MGRLPDFVILGAMKCGTSTLHEQLALRSGVFMSTPKEPNFFSDDAQWARGLDWYRALFDGARPDQLCGESSTHYTKLPTHPRAAERLHAHVPEARLVYVMRDPLSRIVSQYQHEWSQREVEPGFVRALERHERFVAYSEYARQLEPYLAAWGTERVLPLAFERMLAHPDDVLREVCAFLGDPSPEPVAWNTELEAQNVSSERLRKSALRERLLAIGPVRALKDALPAGWRDVLKSPWKMRRKPEIPAHLRARFVARLDADLARLGQQLGVELTCDGWKTQVRDRPLSWVDRPADGTAR